MDPPNKHHNETFTRDFDSDLGTEMAPGIHLLVLYDAINNPPSLIRMPKLVLHEDAASQFGNEILERLMDKAQS